MKQNHIKVEAAIRQALQACGNDFSLEDTRAALRRALALVSQAGQKRVKRNVQAARYAEEAKKKHDTWWNNIMDGVRKNAELEQQLTLENERPQATDRPGK